MTALDRIREMGWGRYLAAVVLASIFITGMIWGFAILGAVMAP